MTGWMNTYNRVDVAFERGEGAYLIAVDGGVAGFRQRHRGDRALAIATRIW